jgi:hypothetical protein
MPFLGEGHLIARLEPIQDEDLRIVANGRPQAQGLDELGDEKMPAALGIELFRHGLDAQTIGIPLRRACKQQRCLNTTFQNLFRCERIRYCPRVLK